MRKIPSKTYHEIPKENLYNMDEVATNTYDYRRMKIGSATDFGRAFQITPVGTGECLFI